MKAAESEAAESEAAEMKAVEIDSTQIEAVLAMRKFSTSMAQVRKISQSEEFRDLQITVDESQGKQAVLLANWLARKMIDFEAQHEFASVVAYNSLLKQLLDKTTN